jgi:predicted GTPase
VKRIVICGAGGRDFHNFNVVYRGDADAHVVAFTAMQVPGIEGRRYPASLAGPRYPDGIPIVPESELDALCRREAVDTVVFAYSDASHLDVMHVASRVLAAGCSFAILGPRATMLAARAPVIAISAVRTGCGKSQTARHLAQVLQALGDVDVVDPRPSVASDITRVYARYPHSRRVLPAMGYSEAQLAALRASINASNAEVVPAATPVDLARLGGIEKPVVRAHYGYADAGAPTLASIVLQRLGAFPASQPPHRRRAGA